ncbi:MAG: fasciclin domain-containing protein [Bacteroidales bacterium]|nr:fasciclin domain-containing protein [Bacteroidales bacterium]
MKTTARQLLSRGSQLFVLLLALLLSGCDEDPVLWEVESAEQVITEYIASNPQYSEFAGILETTGLNSLLSVRGPFTVFLPTNDAMEAYYTENGVSSYTDFSEEFLKDLAMNHMVPSRMETGDFGLGAIRDLNALGDYLVTEFDGAEIIVNKQSLIIKRNISAANGVIHLIDRVIEPVKMSVYEFLASNPSFSLFKEGLDRTGLSDTLNVIDFPYGNKDARTRFTILAVTDTTFNRYGISNIDQLITYFTDAPDSITYLENEFYRYMEYHCLGETYYLNQLESRVYPILSYDNNIDVRIAEDYKLNLQVESEQYTGFIINHSNYPAKNGTVHTINDLLTVFEPEPTVIQFETTDYFEMKQGDYFGKYYMRWFDGQNTFKYIKWEGDYLLYYFKDHDTGWVLNDDCLSMSGWWWCEITTPKIMKGKYNMTSNLWSGQINYAVYVDGVNTALIKSTDPAESTSWGVFDWTTTTRHTIRVVAKSPGLLFWDYITLTPVD